MSITIEGKEYEVVKDDTDRGQCLLLRPLQQPTFSVGMRVEAKRLHLVELDGFTSGMVYKLINFTKEEVIVIGDDCKTRYFFLDSLSEYFTPYEKPKKWEKYWILECGEVECSDWEDDKYDNNRWNLGLAFAGKNAKEQAEFARERLSKLF